MTTFGERLRVLRVECGLSQTAVANQLADRYPELRVSQTAYSVWENQGRAPRGVVLDALADYFNVTPAYFVDQDSDASNILTPNEMRVVRLYRAKSWPELLRLIASELSQRNADTER